MESRNRNQTRPPVDILGAGEDKDLRAKDGARTQRAVDESRIVEIRGPVILAEFMEQRLLELLVRGRL